MNEIQKNQDIEKVGFLTSAYEFLSTKGFSEQVAEIRASKDRYKSYSSTLRRGKIVNLLEKNNLLEEFVDQYWTIGKTNKGKQKIQRYKRIYDAFLNQETEQDEEEEESIEETSFAYEADLRDYLANNLSAIEQGLKLYKDENGSEGVEYPIDANNKRIDILAIDQNNIPVVIELKVSKGYEKAIGQCLYYKNRIKQIFNSNQVRIIIIAREISDQLQLAVEDLNDVELFEYKLSIKLEKINHSENNM